MLPPGSALQSTHAPSGVARGLDRRAVRVYGASVSAACGSALRCQLRVGVLLSVLGSGLPGEAVSPLGAGNDHSIRGDLEGMAVSADFEVLRADAVRAEASLSLRGGGVGLAVLRDSGPG